MLALVGQDAELEHARGADLFLDRGNFRLLDAGNDDLDLTLAELANDDLFLSAGIHAAIERGHELVEVHAASAPSSA